MVLNIKFGFGIHKMSGVEIAMAVATAANVGGQIYQGISALQSAQLQSAITEREGQFALSRSTMEAENIAIEGERAIAEARASAGAYGFDLTGSASDIFARIAAERTAAARGAAFDGDLAYKNAQIEAEQIRKTGKQQFISSMMGAVSEGISGGVALRQEIGARKSTNYRAPPRNDTFGRELKREKKINLQKTKSIKFGLFNRGQ